MEEKIVNVVNEMAEYLNISQMKKLQEVLLEEFSENEPQKENIENSEYLKMFLNAKRIEGCSERTLAYYRITVERLIHLIEGPIRKMDADTIRGYLVEYQKINNCSKVTVDNIRRNISSFFSWLEEEDYILKSPMRRIHKIKTKKAVKEVISDESIERLRDNCHEKRDSYVVVEIKTGKFDSSFAGQLGTYVVAVNHQMKSETDNSTLGLLICKDMDKIEAQYALESTSQPLGISSYELSKLIPEEFKGSMPTIEEIETKLNE